MIEARNLQLDHKDYEMLKSGSENAKLRQCGTSAFAVPKLLLHLCHHCLGYRVLKHRVSILPLT